MSTSTVQWVPVSSLYLGAQITYDRREFIVLEVLEQPIGGWVAIAHAVDDGDHPVRYGLVFGNPVATVALAHREVGMS